MRLLPNVHLDGYIYQEIIALNMLGLHTRFCCSGHPGRRYHPYVLFEFSERTAKYLLKARGKFGTTASIQLEYNNGLVIIARHRVSRVGNKIKYSDLRMFRTYLRGVIAMIREDKRAHPFLRMGYPFAIEGGSYA